MNKPQNSSANPLHEGRKRLEESQKKTVDGIWAAVILLGLLVLVVIMHWFRTN